MKNVIPLKSSSTFQSAQQQTHQPSRVEMLDVCIKTKKDFLFQLIGFRLKLRFHAYSGWSEGYLNVVESLYSFNPPLVSNFTPLAEIR